jgi:hypothetical protein
MARINVNLDDVNENNLLDPDWYRVVVTNFEEKQGEKARYISWELEVRDEKVPDSHPKLWHNTPIEGKGLGILKRFVMACGVEWDADGFDTESVLGSELEVQVDHRTYNDKTYNNVKELRSI